MYERSEFRNPEASARNLYFFMEQTREKNIRKIRRQRRARARIRGIAERPRMSVFRSNKHLWIQLIDDAARHTIAAVSDRELSSKKAEGRVAGAVLLGVMIAKKAQEKNIASVVFDRGSYRYHGIVRAVAEGARKGGLVL